MPFQAYSPIENCCLSIIIKPKVSDDILAFDFCKYTILCKCRQVKLLRDKVKLGVLLQNAAIF